MSVVGTTMFKMDGNPYYNPPFPRGGLAAVFAADVTNVVGAPTVTMTVQHRNEDETTFGDLGSFTPFSNTGVKKKDLEGCKEILRIKYEFDAGDDATDGFHVVMMAPSWRPYA